jgi:hypothetical protein
MKTKRKPKAKAKARTAPARGPKRRRAVRRAERTDDARAFIPDPSEGGQPPSEDLAELLGEDFIESATRGNDVMEDDLSRELPDEVGGPFVLTRDRDELAYDVDASNPPDAEREAFPRATAGLVQPSGDELPDARPARRRRSPRRKR